MAYVGNSPEKGNFRKADSISVVNGQATYNLLVGGVAVNPNQNQCIVSLNGVIQSSGDSYTIANSQITFVSNLQTGDVIDFILILGDTLDVGVPSDDTVGLAQLSATGTASSSTYLRGDNSWQTISAGTSLSGSTDNTVTTVTGANAIQGETNFIYNGTIVGAGADGANADLGVGLHVKSADSSASVDSSADELVIEGSGASGMTLLSGTSSSGSIYFGDSGDNDIGYVAYNHSGNYMMFGTNANERMRISSSGYLQIGTTSGSAQLDVEVSAAITGAEVTCTSGSYDANVINAVCSRVTTNETYNIYRGANGDGSGFFAVRDSGNVENANNSYGSSSDERIKQNIVDANSQWDDIKALKIRNYKLKKEVAKGVDKTYIGVVAQEVETAGMNGLIGGKTAEDKETVALSSDFGTLYEDGDVLPEGKKVGDIKTLDQRVKSVKYSILYMKAIKALQEAQTRIETLETKVKTLEDA